jgi:hypothetical protein
MTIDQKSVTMAELSKKYRQLETALYHLSQEAYKAGFALLESTKQALQNLPNDGIGELTLSARRLNNNRYLCLEIAGVVPNSYEKEFRLTTFTVSSLNGLAVLRNDTTERHEYAIIEPQGNDGEAVKIPESLKVWNVENSGVHSATTWQKIWLPLKPAREVYKPSPNVDKPKHLAFDPMEHPAVKRLIEYAESLLEGNANTRVLAVSKDKRDSLLAQQKVLLDQAVEVGVGPYPEVRKQELVKAYPNVVQLMSRNDWTWREADRTPTGAPEHEERMYRELAQIENHDDVLALWIMCGYAANGLGYASWSSAEERIKYYRKMLEII